MITLRSTSACKDKMDVTHWQLLHTSLTVYFTSVLTVSTSSVPLELNQHLANVATAQLIYHVVSCTLYGLHLYHTAGNSWGMD